VTSNSQARQPDGKLTKKPTLIRIAWYVGIALLAFGVIGPNFTNREAISYSQFQRVLADGDVTKVVSCGRYDPRRLPHATGQRGGRLHDANGARRHCG
jgi:hypothetical protein